MPLTEADLKDYAEKTPCMRSGFCCSKAPCPYGEVKSATDFSCKFLEPAGEVAPGVPVTRCGRYDWIMQNVPKAHWMVSPAFGAGCCSPLFNEKRNAIIRALRP